MLDFLGKIYEKLIKARIQTEAKNHGNLPKQQHGFRKGRSILTAIKKVVQAALRTETGNHRTRKMCILVTFDVKNAFNSLRWVGVIEALKKFDISEYLIEVCAKTTLMTENSYARQQTDRCGKE